jgi:hypothetical protein
MNRNLAASIRDRLKQRAHAAHQDFNFTLTHYGLERLLYRMSVSTHANRFLLKGALLFALWYDQPHRPTRDADLLAFGPDDIDAMVATFREIGSIAVEDGIAFDVANIKGMEIRKAAGSKPRPGRSCGSSRLNSSRFRGTRKSPCMGRWRSLPPATNPRNRAGVVFGMAP